MRRVEDYWLINSLCVIGVSASSAFIPGLRGKMNNRRSERGWRERGDGEHAQSAEV